jgi:hypothetical protein
MDFSEDGKTLTELNVFGQATVEYNPNTGIIKVEGGHVSGFAIAPLIKAIETAGAFFGANPPSPPASITINLPGGSIEEQALKDVEAQLRQPLQPGSAL